MIKFIEGYDLHAKTSTGLNISQDDENKYVSHWTLTANSFVEGHDSPGALRITEYSDLNILPTGAIRIGFWGRGDLIRPAGGEYDFIRFHAGTLSTIHPRITVTNAGSFRLQEQDVTFPSTTTPVSGYTDINKLEEGTFHYYEAYWNPITGKCTFKIDNIVEIDETLTTDASGYANGIAVRFGQLMNLPFQTWFPVIDHLWVTDGDELDGSNEIQALAVSAGQDGYDAGFRGTMIIDGTRYITEWDLATSTATSSPGFFTGVNVCSVVNYLFATDPSDGEPWTAGKYANIDGWGLCHAPDGNTEEVRLRAMSLLRLDYNDGKPLVTSMKPSTVTQFSGNWEKSDTSLTYGGHFQDQPRDDNPLADEVNHLSISENGCLIFPLVDVDPDDYVFTQIGLTFAEEFREDNRDFVRVLGDGLSFASFFTSGYGIYGEGNREFQSNYVTVNYENIPTGGAYIQGLWDYTTDRDTGRWSMRQQVYHQSAGYKHAARKLKIRGNGKAMQLRVLSEGDKPFKINGWTLLVTSDTTV